MMTHKPNIKGSVGGGSKLKLHLNNYMEKGHKGDLVNQTIQPYYNHEDFQSVSYTHT